MIASTFLCSLVIGLVSTRIVEPRFPVYHSKDEDETIQEVTLLEVKGLHRAGFAVVLYIAILAIGFFAGVLSKDGHTLVGSLLLKGLIPILFSSSVLPASRMASRRAALNLSRTSTKPWSSK